MKENAKTYLKTKHKWRVKFKAHYDFYLNREKDKDVIQMLDLQRSKRAYIIKLIRDDIERKTKLVEELQNKKR